MFSISVGFNHFFLTVKFFLEAEARPYSHESNELATEICTKALYVSVIYDFLFSVS